MERGGKGRVDHTDRPLQFGCKSIVTHVVVGAVRREPPAYTGWRRYGLVRVDHADRPLQGLIVIADGVSLVLPTP